MTLAIDNISRKRLVFVRQIFKRALSQAETQHSPTDRLLALIGFDLSNETLIKTVIRTVSTKSTKDLKFHELLKTADEGLASQSLPLLPDVGHVRRVRELRNNAQHDAVYPNESDLSDCRTYTRDFITQTVSLIWAEDFDALTMVDLILEDSIKGWMVNAESEFAKGEYDRATMTSMYAFRLMLQRAFRRVLDRRYWRSHRDQIFQHEVREVYVEIDDVKELLVYSVIGLDFKSYLKYRNYTRGIDIADFGNGKFNGMLFNRGSVPQTEARFVIDFVIDAVPQIESLVGIDAKR